MYSGPTFSTPKLLPASQSQILDDSGNPRATFYFSCTVQYNTIGGQADDGARFEVSFIADATEVIKSEIITPAERRAFLYDEDLFIKTGAITYESWAGRQVELYNYTYKLKSNCFSSFSDERK